MYNIIWTKEELKKIKKIILLRANLKVTDDLELIIAKKKFFCCNSSIFSPTYEDVVEEIKEIFYVNDREKIIEILTKASLLETDPNNRLHYGMITTLSKIDPENVEEIFTIFKEIVAQYDKSSTLIAKKIVNGCDNIDEINAKMKEILNSKEITTEEQLIKNDVKKVFIFTKGITDEKIFASLIEKLDSLLKTKLINKLNFISNSIGKEKAKKSDLEISEYKEHSKMMIQRRYMDTLKKRDLKIF